MASIEGIRRRIRDYQPVVQSAFVVYVTPRPSPVETIDESFEVTEVTTPDDPLLAKVCSSKRQLAAARSAMKAGDRWDVVVATRDGVAAGRIWKCNSTEKRYFSGIPRFRLADDEVVLFDLYVEREFRRTGIANTMADYFFKMYDPELETTPKYVYGFISYENVPSILWHDSVGFQIAQTVNYLAIGPNIKWKMPFSDMPRFGPLSRRGRHTDPERQMFGPRLMP